MLDGFQSGIWTSTPGIVQTVDLDEMTCSILPAIKAQTRAPDGTLSLVQLPLLIHCPLIYQTGGGFTMTLPVKPNDEALVLFSCRCIDGWWQSGGIQVPLEFRMHDLSDGFALIGPRSKARLIGSISSTSAQLRTDDGQTFVDVSQDTITLMARDGSNLVIGNGQAILTAEDGSAVTLGEGKGILSSADAVVHGTDTASIDAGGTGIVYMPALIEDYTQGVTVDTFPPNPPGPLS